MKIFQIGIFIIIGCISVFGVSFEPRNWFTSYPQGGSSIGPFLAISWPIELTDQQEMLFSFYYEANFALPTNVTQYYNNYTGDTLSTENSNNESLNTGDTLSTENSNNESLNTLYELDNLFNMTRMKVYQLVENRLTREGYNGQVCLLKFICEISSMSLLQTSLLSELIQLLLTPSSSATEQGLSQYVEAERLGSENSESVGCDREYSGCETSLTDLLPFD